MSHEQAANERPSSEFADSQQITKFLMQGFNLLNQLSDDGVTALSADLQGLASFEQYDKCDITADSFPGQEDTVVNAITFVFRHSMRIAGEEQVSERTIVLSHDESYGRCSDEYDFYNQDEVQRWVAEDEHHAEFMTDEERHAELIELVHNLLATQLERDKYEDMDKMISFVTAVELEQLAELLARMLKN